MGSYTTRNGAGVGWLPEGGCVLWQSSFIFAAVFVSCFHTRLADVRVHKAVGNKVLREQRCLTCVLCRGVITPSEAVERRRRFGVKCGLFA